MGQLDYDKAGPYCAVPPGMRTRDAKSLFGLDVQVSTDLLYGSMARVCYNGAFIITTRDDLIAGNPEALELPDESLAAALTDIANDPLAERNPATR